MEPGFKVSSEKLENAGIKRIAPGLHDECINH